jgi:predicted RNA-binding protein YlqC (UPF0109 family)
MPETNALSRSLTAPKLDYLQLVKFLVKPLLDSPESLSLDCEVANDQQRVWIRVAFEGEDKGRVFGRGGRNLQAIRTVLSAAAAAAGQSVYLDIYESQNTSSRRQPYPSQSSFATQSEPRKYRQRPSLTPRLGS